MAAYIVNDYNHETVSDDIQLTNHDPSHGELVRYYPTDSWKNWSRPAIEIDSTPDPLVTSRPLPRRFNTLVFHSALCKSGDPFIASMYHNIWLFVEDIQFNNLDNTIEQFELDRCAILWQILAHDNISRMEFRNNDWPIPTWDTPYPDFIPHAMITTNEVYDDWESCGNPNYGYDEDSYFGLNSIETKHLANISHDHFDFYDQPIFSHSNQFLRNPVFLCETAIFFNRHMWYAMTQDPLLPVNYLSEWHPNQVGHTMQVD